MDQHRFDQDTAVTRTGELEFEAEIADRRWWVVRGPHGGFVAAIVLRALIEALGDPARPPRSFTIHYPSAPDVGTVKIAVTIERSGRSTAYLSARVTQNGSVVALALAAFSSGFPGPDYETASMPEVAPPEDIEPIALPGAPAFTEQFDFRFALGGAPFQRADRARTGGWLSLKEAHPLDAPLAATYTDAWPPAIFWLLDDFAIVPTVDLTIHFRESLPLDDETVLAVFDSKRSRDGLWEENGELWSRDGRLLVQSRQLAVHIPRPTQPAA